MGVNYNTKIVREGLVLHLDAANPKSYAGSGTTLFDLSKSKNNAILTNGASIQNKTIVFDGSNDMLTFNSAVNATTLNFNGYHTVELWIKSSAFGTNNGLIECNNTGTSNGYLHYVIRSSKLYLGWYSIDLASSTVLSLDNWYHIIFMFDTDNKQKIYINGILDSSSAVRGSFFNGGIALLRIGYYAGYFNGNISNINIYNRALTADEIKQNFEALRGRYGI